MIAVSSVVEKLLDVPPSAVLQAGEVLLNALSQGKIEASHFLADPLVLLGPPYYAPRYLSQVTLRALQGRYDGVEDVLASLQALEDRNPPVIERGRREAANRVVIPEARVLELILPSKNADGSWSAAIEALITSGPMRGSEVRIELDSRENNSACFLTTYLWIHSTFAAYNLSPVEAGLFAGTAETFFVIEPLRQVNATTVARSLHCVKPQLDQIRRGKGDVTVATLKGMFVHSLFDRLLETPLSERAGDVADELGILYDAVFPRYAFQLCSVVDDFFDEQAFRHDVLRHVSALKQFIDRNPHLREHTQLELKRYSATIGIQGRIDAVFRSDNRLDILELKTGARIRPEDHAQLFIYRLLLSDQLRRWQRTEGCETEITARLLCSTDGTFAPLHIQTDFFRVLDARNKLVATHYALGQETSHFKFRYEGFNSEICGTCPSWMRKKCDESSNLFGDRPGASVTDELKYFRNFSRLIERERWTAEQGVTDLLDDSRTEARRRSFRTLVNTRILPGVEAFTFEFDENTSDIECGDAVLIHSGNISSSASFHGYVRSVDAYRIRISIPLKNLSVETFIGRAWIIDKSPSDVTAEASHSALYDFLAAPKDARKLAILGASEQGLQKAAPIRNSSLNRSQNTAIHRATTCEVFHLIWGPPGTGKTRVIPEIVDGVNGPVLLGAFTNTAVDKMLIALLERDPKVRFLRIGRSSDSPELSALLSDPSEYFSEDLAAKHQTVHGLKKAVESARIVAATAHRAATLPFLRQRSFEMVIVDEAGQLTEPLTLGLILRGRRFVLIGDDRQLPPVVKTQALAFSMFERLKRSGDHLTLLDTQYRMHPDIMAVSNKLFYDGRLISGVTASDRQPLSGPALLTIPVVPEDGGENGQQRVSSARRNLSEAEAVVRLVRAHLAEGVSPASIGVISPFRAQVILLRRLLGELGVSVDTVERFQGGERDIIILSLVRSQGSGFVFDERRFNVAITRARRKLVFVAHPNLFRNSQYEWISTFTETHKIDGVT